MFFPSRWLECADEIFELSDIASTDSKHMMKVAFIMRVAVLFFRFAKEWWNFFARYFDLHIQIIISGERAIELMIWTYKSKWFYHSYAKRKKQSNHNGNKFGPLIDASFRPIFSTYCEDRRTDQLTNLPAEMQFYISVMFLGLPDDRNEEKPSFSKSGNNWTLL